MTTHPDRLSFRLPTLLIAACLAAPLAAQEAQGAPTPTEQEPRDDAAAAAAAAEQHKQEQEQQKQQRLQKIAQVAFDRRPTTALRTWASPPEAGVVNGQPQQQAMGAAPTPQPAQSLGDIEPAIPVPRVKVAMVLSGMPLRNAGAAPTEPEESAANAASDAPPSAAAGGMSAPKEPTAPPTDPFDLSLVQWARAVTLGDWRAVKDFLAGLPTEDEKKAAWMHMLTALGQPQSDPNLRPYFSFDDVLQLCAAAPVARDDAALLLLGGTLRAALDRGLVLEALLAELRAVAADAAAPGALSRRELVKLLFGAGQQAVAGEFLPTLPSAASDRDFEGLNLLAEHLVARHDAEGKQVYLEQAWQALQAIFAAADVDRDQRAKALQRAVAVAPRLQQELGTSWLRDSFTKDVRRGMEIIAQVGVAAAEAAQQQAQNADFRRLTLQLQRTAVEALLATAPDVAEEWSAQLGLLADNWLREAITSHTFDESGSQDSFMRRDRYGNFFYYDPSEGSDQSTLPCREVLDLRPGDAWIELLEPGMQPKFTAVTAQLWLKVKEQDKAFPHIAQLAKTHPKQAEKLVDEFLTVWTQNHDPNAGRHNYYFYGYEQRADGIPLTRSKQDRNLEDLARQVARLRALPLPPPDQQLLVRAFTTCHSSAEVYREDAILAVFGGLDAMEPATLAELAQQMRRNLLTVWRQPSVQEKARTNRKQKDIEAEVERGYGVARATIDRGLQAASQDWQLLLARAMLAHDEIEYRRQLGNDAAFAPKRLAAFADFKLAAQAYAKAVADLPDEDQSLQPFEHWFYAALGSSDAKGISHEHVQVDSQIAAVRQAILALPGEAAERHMQRFAGRLFAQMGSLNPAVKLRYVKAGLEIVGDQKEAQEAKDLADYYADVTSEIQLVARLDGDAKVGSTESFGLFVEIRHTTDIERESGGFGRYLRNQNDVSYSFNYGRPTENYRDKFADAARQALEEHFEVQSITFQSDSVHSRAAEPYGWRVTSYAYLLLKPRGPQVDRVPPLRLDLDFLDTSGYAVLPAESAPVILDCTAIAAGARPFADGEVTQILDERKAKDGKLLLEVKATGHGLPPKLDALLAVEAPGFAVANIEDSGPQVTRFDPEAATDAVTAERTFQVTFVARPGSEPPRQFRFPTAKASGLTMVLQRYQDADLVVAPAALDLEASYGTASRPWLLPTVALLALLLAAAWRFTRRIKEPSAARRIVAPAAPTPFAVLAMLREVETACSLADGERAELQAAMAQIESAYFAAGKDSELDLHDLASAWADRAERRLASKG